MPAGAGSDADPTHVDGGFWAMFLGAGLVALAAIVEGGRLGDLQRRPA